jgi:hypothetical protein
VDRHDAGGYATAAGQDVDGDQVGLNQAETMRA